MIDHVLGRPSTKFRKIQVLAVVSFWSFYLLKGPRHGPATIRKISQRISNLLTPWQVIVITLLYLYTARNLGRLLGLECPEPLANLYTRSYFRATWITTAMDAGFWSAMRIRRKWLRDLASIVFTVYYLIAAEQADEKVRKVRGALTVEHLRVSWNKSTTPYINFINNLLRPRFMKYPPRQIRIARPVNSDYSDSIGAWLYFNGPLSDLKNHDKVVIDIPGGGFIAMNPRHNDDKLIAWAGKTGYPVLSLDYKKAPEYPYPYALNECFDAYRSIVTTNGRCLGLAGNSTVKVILTGDSAGGNLVTGLTLLTIQARQNGVDLPIPDGVILIYPGLDMNIGNWMSDEQMTLIKDRKFRRTNREIIRRKSMQYTLTAGTPHQSEEETNTPPLSIITTDPTAPKVDPTQPLPQYSNVAPPLPSPDLYRAPTWTPRKHSATLTHHPPPMNTRLAMSSLIAYFNDRILSPEMMRAMMILYIGPHNRPDFSTDYLLSPNLAPDSLLVEFPKTYIMTGERDPLVDDTVIFAGRLRRARAMKHAEEVSLGKAVEKEWDDNDIVEVVLIPKISHGFLQFAGCFPEGWKYIHRIGKWIEIIFEKPNSTVNVASQNGLKNSVRSRAESSADEENFLEMGMTNSNESMSRKDRRKRARSLREMNQDESSYTFRRRGKRAGGGRDSIGDRRKSMVRLASEEDLLGRRMLGLAGPLTRVGRYDD